MRIAAHIALQTTALVLVGVGLSWVVTAQTTAALEARAQVHDDARDVERFERLDDVASQYFLTGDLVLSGGTTYLIPVAVEQEKSLQAILGRLRTSPLAEPIQAECETLAARFDSILNLVRRSNEHHGDDRDAALFALLEDFDVYTADVTNRIAQLRGTLQGIAAAREAQAASDVETARGRTLLAMLGLLGLILAASTYLVRATARPLRHLAEHVASARRGERFDAPSGGPWEVRTLAGDFGELVGDLERSRDGLEDEVSRRTAELEQALAARAAFLANTSHELRTPMNAILGFADMLAEDGDQEDAADCLEHIRSSGRHLLALIEDVLDLSKIDAGHMEIESRPFVPLELLGEVESMLAGAAASKGLELATRAEGELPGAVFGDPVRLRQVLVNLVGNALKFTPTGRVSVVLGWQGDCLVATVTDSGIGIPEGKLESIFDEFQQADASSTRRFGGTGLGLAISRRLTRLMGGDLTVTSEEGHGSTFVATTAAPRANQLQLASVSEPVAAMTDEGPPPGARVLLVDDVPTNVLVGRRVLERMGLIVTDASDGERAVAAARAASADGAPFDAILLDLQMPVLDGYDAARQLRLDGFAGPILALSAAALPEQRARALDAGCDDFVAKPIVAATLRSALAVRLARAA